MSARNPDGSIERDEAIVNSQITARQTKALIAAQAEINTLRKALWAMDKEITRLQFQVKALEAAAADERLAHLEHTGQMLQETITLMQAVQS